jgi:hypothetical protein
LALSSAVKGTGFMSSVWARASPWSVSAAREINVSDVSDVIRAEAVFITANPRGKPLSRGSEHT